MIINGLWLLQAQPIVGMLDIKVQEHGVSHGLSEVGYDIRLKQDIWFWPQTNEDSTVSVGRLSSCQRFSTFQSSSGVSDPSLPQRSGTPMARR